MPPAPRTAKEYDAQLAVSADVLRAAGLAKSGAGPTTFPSAAASAHGNADRARHVGTRPGCWPAAGQDDRRRPHGCSGFQAPTVSGNARIAKRLAGRSGRHGARQCAITVDDQMARSGDQDRIWRSCGFGPGAVTSWPFVDQAFQRPLQLLLDMRRALQPPHWRSNRLSRGKSTPVPACGGYSCGFPDADGRWRRSAQGVEPGIEHPVDQRPVHDPLVRQIEQVRLGHAGDIGDLVDGGAAKASVL